MEADERRAQHELDRRTLLCAAGSAAALAGCGPAGAPESAKSAEAPQNTSELDQLFADLTDQSATAAPIDADARSQRRARAAELLVAHGADALLVEPGPTLTYLAGVSWGVSERFFGLVLLADGAHFWIAPAFEEPKARLRIEAPAGPGGAIVPWDEHEYAWAPLAAELAARRVERVLVDPPMRSFALERVRAAHGPERVALGDRLLVELRGRKEPAELALLRRANELTQRAISAVAERARPGMSADELGNWIQHAQRRLGLARPWVLPLIGPAAAFPHGDHGDERLEPGAVVLVDTGGGLHGYQSDITRTWVFGAPPSADALRVWNAVRDAQKRAFDAMRPGVEARELDRIARASIEAAGFGSGYAACTHRLGHGIGLEGHEEPYLDGGNDRPLVPGNTFSDEPGIYLYGKFGVRIEDIVAVTETGADHFGEWQASPARP